MRVTWHTSWRTSWQLSGIAGALAALLAGCGGRVPVAPPAPAVVTADRQAVAPSLARLLDGQAARVRLLTGWPEATRAAVLAEPALSLAVWRRQELAGGGPPGAWSAVAGDAPPSLTRDQRARLVSLHDAWLRQDWPTINRRIDDDTLAGLRGSAAWTAWLDHLRCLGALAAARPLPNAGATAGAARAIKKDPRAGWTALLGGDPLAAIDLIHLAELGFLPVPEPAQRLRLALWALDLGDGLGAIGLARRAGADQPLLAARSRLVVAAGLLRLGSTLEARDEALAAADAAQAADDGRIAALALTVLAEAADARGQRQAAVACARRAMELADGDGLRERIDLALTWLGAGPGGVGPRSPAAQRRLELLAATDDTLAAEVRRDADAAGDWRLLAWEADQRRTWVGLVPPLAW